jgi:hypothetical protein
MIDHLVYATPDLEPTIAELAERLGVQPAIGGRHLGRGTRNALVGLGGKRYLEIIGPDPEQGEPAEPRPFGIDDLDGAGLATWCARSSKPLADAVMAARTVGIEPGDPTPMSRLRPDGVRLEWVLTVPQMSGQFAGVVPFLIDWGESPHPSASAPAGVDLVQLRLAHPDPERLHVMLSALGADDGVELVEGSRPAVSALLSTSDGVLQLG